MRLRDRADAGRQLAERLSTYRNDPNAIVLALPRGGVPVAYEVARALALPLDVYLVRKLGVPGHEELAMGAIASGGTCVLDEATIASTGTSRADVADAIARERAEMKRRELRYRGDVPEPDLHGKTVIVVDDGIATGASMRAVVEALRRREPRRIVVAVPVASSESVSALERVADAIVCIAMPEPFYAVGLYYADFRQLEDDDVTRLLTAARRERAQWSAA